MERTAGVNPGPREHLVIQTAFLGDLLLSLPMLRQLRLLFPHDRLTLFCRRGLGDFMLRSGAVDEVVEADKSSKSNWRQAVNKLSSRRFELLICPHESLRSSVLAFQLHAKRKIAYTSWWGPLVFTDRVVRPLELPESLRQLALLEPLDGVWKERLATYAHEQTLPGGQSAEGLQTVPEWAAMTVPQLAAIQLASQTARLPEEKLALLPPKARAVAIVHQLAMKPTIFIAPGSVWPTKMWTEGGFIVSAQAYAAKGFAVVAMGSPDEKEICQRIVEQVPGAISLAGETSLYDSAALLALASLLICNDSGAMHMASAAGVPTVSVFGPTVLEFGYRPWQNQAAVVELSRAEMPCRPCGKHGAKACPIGTHACMKQLPPSRVLVAADKLLDLK